MKKQMSLFAWAAAIFGISSVLGVAHAETEFRSYNVKPSERSQLYRDYTSSSSKTVKTESKTTNDNYAVNKTAQRKYYLAHPFFQPTKGRFGSVTDLSSANASYDIKITPINGSSISDDAGNWDTGEFSVQEDLSYGISDTVSIIGSVKYSSSDYKMDWSLPTTVDDSVSNSGIDVYGIGLQWRFVDSEKWIATISGFYQDVDNIANAIVINAGAGYKVGRSTIYSLARFWNLSLDGNSYGNGITDASGDSFLIAYKAGVSSASYLEMGAGMFSVLDKNWTLNLELVMGNYDWHNQGSVKAAIGWQPNDNFALNFYAKTAIYDSADDKNLDFWYYSATSQSWAQLGTAKVSGYSETSFGVQGILYF